jgi:hypothetical protein
MGMCCANFGGYSSMQLRLSARQFDCPASDEEPNCRTESWKDEEKQGFGAGTLFKTAVWKGTFALTSACVIL